MSTPAVADRNLLFGILALQMDFISRDALLAAMQAWVFHKSTPLGQVLLEQGALRSDTHALLEALVDKHLEMHGDVEQSLASVSSTGALCGDLRQIGDPDLCASLALVSSRKEEESPTTCAPGVGPNEEAEPLATPPPTAAMPFSAAWPDRLLDRATAGRNLLYEEIGHGGMGVVLRGRDPDLGRDLAVKLLLPQHQGDAGLERRFVEEAQIAGQLQHPGVVPIYELGRFMDQRPYFTMKLIKGRTLAELLAGRPDPGHELPRYLGIFEQVCQAVAYAHSKGVIHRDLKPSNIMVGAFGEVQVMDWGLAKVLVRIEPDDPEQSTAGRPIRTIRSGSTVDGQEWTGVVGTPAFMAPEQARGEVDRVDERADVFGLGAILYVILSGRPPHPGRGDEALQRAMEGDLREALARLDACGAEAELVVLARECLHAQCEGRPRNAGVVAQRMTAYLAAVQQRLRAAEVERAAAQARAEEATKKVAAQRRARRLLLGLATAVLLLVVGGGGVAWMWQQQRQEAGMAASEAMSEARLRLRDGRFAEAEAAAVQAEQLARTAGATAVVLQQAQELAEVIRSEAAAARRDRRLLAALLEVRGPREGLTYRADDRSFMAALAEPSADEQFAAAFREWDATFDVDRMSTQEAAVRLRARPAAVRAEVIAALDEWASERQRQKRPEARWRRVVDLAAALDDEAGPRGGELRRLLARGALERERALGMLALALRPVPVPFDAGLGSDRQRLRRLAARTDVAVEPVLGLLTLARALQAAGDDLLAERLLGAAVRARPHEVVLQHSLGQVREGQGRWREAVECLAAARALRPELGVSLAEALVKAGQVDEGLALFERLTAQRADNPWLRFVHGYALADQGRYKEAEDAYRAAVRLKPDLPEAHANLGYALLHQGRHKEAEDAYRTAVRLKFDLPRAYTNLGYALLRQGRPREAEAACRTALRFEPDYSEVHINLGVALNDQGRHREAEAACREGIRLKPDLPEAHYNLGLALLRQGRHKEAEATYRQAIRLKPDYPDAHNNLGSALSRQARHREAEAACRAAIRLKPDYSQAHNNLGVVLHGQGRHKEAETAFRQVISLEPNDPVAHNNLGGALIAQARYKEAEVVYRAAIRLKPDYSQAHNNLGTALNDQGRHQEAEDAYRAALCLKPDDPLAHYGLGLALYDQGRHKEAEAAYRQALRLKHDYPEAHCNLGHALRHQGHFGEALQSLRRGHALANSRPGWHYPSAAWVRQCQRLVELGRLLPAVLNGEAQPASAQERLELAALCQLPCKRLHATAARFAADAFRAGPKQANDLDQGHRYNAACSAALAAAGQADDARVLPDRVVLKLRRQAYRWLRADLTVYAGGPGHANPQVRETVRQRLIHWRSDADLVSLRDAAALVRLDADERQQWQKLWQEVDALLRKVAPKK
jgi:Flp pilus assembly protein TadD